LERGVVSSLKEVELLEKAGDVQGLLKLHKEQEDKELETAMKGARASLMRRARSYTTKKVRPPKFVWVLLAVYLGRKVTPPFLASWRLRTSPVS
jgi:hypothetical protein